MTRIAIFASGRGSNAIKIHQYGINTGFFEVSLIVSNKKNAGVIDYARTHEIPFTIIDRATLYDSETIADELIQAEIDLIVLAGFLWLVPGYLVDSFPGRIINIHPALLPAYGGKGMYGKFVHQAVEQAGEAFSGITIHYVNKVYDDGAFILQTRTPVNGLTAEKIGEEVLKLEHFFYPRVIGELASHFKAAG